MTVKKKIILWIISILATLCILIILGIAGYFGYNYYIENQNSYKTPELTRENPFKLLGQINKKTIDIGEPFEYVVTLFKRNDTTVILNKKDIKKNAKDFKNLIINDFKEDIKKNKDTTIIKHTYFLQPKDTQGIQIPAIKAFSSKIKQVLGPINVKINTTLDPKNEMKDIHDIKPLERSLIINLWYIFVPLITLIITILAILWIIKIIKSPKKVKTIEIYKPPHIIALEDLAKLKMMELKTPEDYKEFYTILSEVFRRYLEGRFKVQAIEKTSEEILAELIKIQFNMHTRNQAKSILKQSDMVKFAKVIPTREMANAALEKTYQFVDMTKQDYLTDFE